MGFVVLLRACFLVLFRSAFCFFLVSCTVTGTGVFVEVVRVLPCHWYVYYGPWYRTQ